MKKSTPWSEERANIILKITATFENLERDEIEEIHNCIIQHGSVQKSMLTRKAPTTIDVTDWY